MYVLDVVNDCLPYYVLIYVLIYVRNIYTYYVVIYVHIYLSVHGISEFLVGMGPIF